ELIETSRQAGMAEVATGVLHNVGNVLNSVNISATVIAENLQKSKAANLLKVVQLLEENAADIGEFMTGSRGKQVPLYLSQLAGQLAIEQQKGIAELDLLRKNIDHIKDIVAMQQNYAKVSGVTETVRVEELVEDALQMNEGSLKRHEVEVVREYSPVPRVTLEKHKVLQILVNLIRNAKYACDDSGRVDKRLTVRITTAEQDSISIDVADNGVGIPPENMTRIFNHGFTTRKTGHGFGLHSGALVAKEMGGVLKVHSDGTGQGATFTLVLPIRFQKARHV
ncbi:MAG: GHKL domain-containing protein, partial [Akkermansiaceae bacterium]|nr:GHKL domain-containing protein [Verrucomicrobiales bacterium]